jgi:DNA-binding PadR family transcriptional regulator
MADKSKIVLDWDAEQKKIEDEYKRKLAELKKMREDNEMVDKILTRGILPILVLNMIYKHPANGNEVSTRIADITHGSWQPSTGGIYPILKRFEKQGFIKGEWDDPDKRVKRIYTITGSGADELEHQKDSLINSLNKTVQVFNDILKSFE